MTQSTSYTAEDKILWIVGSLERLATFGFLSPEVPWKVSIKGLDKYLNLDEDRYNLFTDYVELIQVIASVIKSESNPVPSDEEIAQIAIIVVNYFHNRDELVKYALSQSFA